MYQIDSLKEMKEFAFWMADKLMKAPKREKALALALSGELGSGKTTFTQYFLRALGVKGKITSPSFTLMKNYELPVRRSLGAGGRIKNYEKAYHVDCYRIKKHGDFKVFNLKDIFNVSQNVVLIEWPERINKVLPKNTIWLKFEHGEKSNQRIIKISST